jgi:hypothetical protein
VPVLRAVQVVNTVDALYSSNAIVLLCMYVCMYVLYVWHTSMYVLGYLFFTFCITTTIPIILGGVNECVWLCNYYG